MKSIPVLLAVIAVTLGACATTTNPARDQRYHAEVRQLLNEWFLVAARAAIRLDDGQSDVMSIARVTASRPEYENQYRQLLHERYRPYASLAERMPRVERGVARVKESVADLVATKLLEHRAAQRKTLPEPAPES